MSHSKFAKNVDKKAKTGAQKSKLFSRAVKLIMVEARLSGGNKEASGLKSAIEKAREIEMPIDNIERAIKKAIEAPENLESILYEGYGPGGSQFVIEALTESRNKAAQEIRHIFTKYGYSLGGPGSVLWAFTKKSTNWIPNQEIELRESDLEVYEKMIEELEENDEVQNIYTNFKS